MSGFSSRDLIQLWQRGQAAPSLVEKAALVLAFARPDLSSRQIWNLNLSRRDRLLANVFSENFGNRLECLTRCPRCREKLDFALQTEAWKAPGPQPRQEYSLVFGSYRLHFRLLTGLDLLSASRLGELHEVRKALVRKCLLRIYDKDEQITELPPHLETALGSAIEQYDPLANTEVDLVCPACRHGWAAFFDISAYLWKAIDGRVRRLLRDVHLLARAYGWAERDIIDMHAVRRRFYLEQVLG